MLRKTTILLAATALVLSAAPMVAQDAATGTPERTNVDAANLGPANPLTVEGTVREVKGTDLVLETSTGIHHIQLVDLALDRSQLEPGTRVSVDYNRNSQGVMIAQNVRLAESKSAESSSDGMATGSTRQADVSTGTTTSATTEDSAMTETEADLAEADEPLDQDSASDRWATASQENDEMASATTDETLPQTGSDLPLIALLGLAGFAGAGALRRLAS